LEGELPPAKLKLVLAWLEIHREDLLADWNLAVQGQQVFQIDPLRFRRALQNVPGSVHFKVYHPGV